jgi:hypothetical protein
MNNEFSCICPLVEREIWDSECYDIQMVRHSFISPRVLDFLLDKTKSNAVCENCDFNQLKEVSKNVKQMILI